LWPLFTRAFTKADYLQPISTFLLEWARRMGFTGEAQVIPNAVDVAKFSERFAAEDIDARKKKLDKKPGDIFLITTSRLVPKNAADDIIRAVALLPERVSLLIYGIGPEEARLRELASASAVTERVRFMGEIAHADLPLTLAAADIFVRPSRSEGMGNSF